MNIQTKYHGEVVIQQENILTFPKGIPAFEDEKQFIILPLDEKTPFSILQSTKTSNLAFVIGDVFSLFPEYDIELSQNAVEVLELSNSEDAIVYCIITVKEPFMQSTANLQGPIVINSVKKIGKQVVLNQSNYKTKHELVGSPALSK
ncbi:flagellar assembly protein FliW [Gottfriedia luciferensis]|uniref:flagellar assembly protein FliW n=1 Tax=Gottfriedia luciferensis TaxID=178774 RepID=UPI000B452F22|nr:flagellar assembly protein FliW [Gottfriedia luciferensis]